MFPQNSAVGRKRWREDEGEVETPTKGFIEHRTKRQMAALSLRQSPEIRKRSFPTLAQPLRPPTLADITPTGSDSEEVALITEPKPTFSSWIFSPGQSLSYNSPPSPRPQSTQLSQIEGPGVYTNDLEMTDSGFLCPEAFQSDPAASIGNRIPTPIHCQFSSHIHSADRAPPYSIQGMNFVEGAVIGEQRSHRLPSPISEDETSPSFKIENLEDIQMEVEPGQEESRAAPKKGHTRSKYSLRTWGGPGSDLGCGSIKRGFSMGYRSDCEKCRMKVPGHFSHIITY